MQKNKKKRRKKKIERQTLQPKRKFTLSKVLLRNPADNFYHTKISFPQFKWLKPSLSSMGNSFCQSHNRQTLKTSICQVSQQTHTINLQLLRHQQSLFAEELVQYVFKLQLSTRYA